MRECPDVALSFDGPSCTTLFCHLEEGHNGNHKKETAGGDWFWNKDTKPWFETAWTPDGKTPISQVSTVISEPPAKPTVSARELAGYHAAMMLAESAHAALELIDGPASVRDQDKAAEILRTALGCTSAALEVAGSR